MDITLQMRSLELMLKMIKHDMSGVPPYGYRRQKYDPPADSTLSLLPRCTPEEAGLSSPAVERFFAAVDEESATLGPHGILLLRHGKVLAEGWWAPYRRELPHMLYSMSKSVVGTAVGINALLSRRLGEKNFEAANKVAENGIFVTVLSWAVFAVFGAACSGLFMGAFTQNAEILAGGTDYMWIVTVFSLGLFMSVTMERVLQVTGKTVYQMISQMTGAVVNIILDPVFIFGWLGLPAMGVAGAAWATVIGQFCGMAVGIGINHVKNHEVRLNFRRFRPDWHSIKGIYQVGLPSIIMQSIGSVMTFGMNKILIAFTETAVSVFGVYFKLQSFVFMPVFGVTNALVPIVGYNYGARSSQRIQQATRLSLLMTTAIMALGTVIFQVAPGPLLSLFSASDTMLSIGIPALRIISVSFCFAGVAIVFSSVFQALGDGMLSLVMSAVRQLLLLLPCAFVLAKLGGLDAVWLSFLIAEVASVTLAVVFYRSLYNKKIRHI